MDFDLRLRTAIYRHFADDGTPPSADRLASELHARPEEIREAYRRLAERRMLVLTPDGESIRMAPPFSAIETQHEAHAQGRRYFANCAWDAFGIPAALRMPADVVSRCEQTQRPLRLALPEGLQESTWVFHAAVPAAHWWNDIVYT